jgi:hypothetical protein
MANNKKKAKAAAADSSLDKVIEYMGIGGGWRR